MKKKSASLWILILLIISSLTAPVEAAKKVREDHLVYQKDRELWITNGKHEPVKLTEGLYSKYFERTIDIRPLLSYGKEGRMLLIPQKIGISNSNFRYIYDLFCVDLMDNTYLPKKIDENIYHHKASDKQQVIYYEKLKEEIVDDERILKSDIYRFDFSRKEKVAEGKIQAVSDDGRTVLFIDNDALYKKTVGQETIKIADDFPPNSTSYSIVELDRSLDTIYYIPGGETLYKKVKNNPVEKVMENWNREFSYKNILDHTSYRNGTFYYFQESLKEEETKKTYGDFIVDDITPQIYGQMDESTREKVDKLREEMDDQIDHFFTNAKLYFYDGKTSRLVEEGELVDFSSIYEIDLSCHQGNRSIYAMVNREPFPKVKLSEVLERDKKNWENKGEQRDPKSEIYWEELWERQFFVGAVLKGMVKEKLTRQHIFEDGKRIGVSEGGEMNLGFSKKTGELLFFKDIKYGLNKRGDFYSAKLENNKIVSPRLIRKEIHMNPMNIQLYETSLMQKKSMYVGENDKGEDRYDLYADGKGILSANQEQIDYNSAMDTVIFYEKESSWLPDTLWIYHNKKVTEIPKVDCGLGRITFFNDSFIAFRKYMEESSHPFGLVLFDGQKERIVAGGVDKFIVAGPSNYVEGNDRPWIPRW